jgi:signal transduction histidine kinase
MRGDERSAGSSDHVTLEAAFDAERAEWLRRRYRLISAGLSVTIIAFTALSPAMLGSAAEIIVLAVAGGFAFQFFWLGTPRSYRSIERVTVVGSIVVSVLSGAALDMLSGALLVQIALSLLVTSMIVPALMRISWRSTALVIFVSIAVVGTVMLSRHRGSPPIGVVVPLLFVLAGAVLTLDAASRDRLARREFEARERLMASHRLLQREEDTRSRLFINLSHDFRTPLALILGEVEQLGRRPAAEVDPAVARIKGNVRLMTDLIEQLLELARIDAGRTPHRPADFEVEGVAKEVVALLETTDKRVEIVGGECVAHADSGHVRRILLNLVANGLRAIRKGQRVQIRLSSSPTAAIIDVADDGPGIASERRVFIFDRFTAFDGDGSTVSGIGLPLARELASLNGGTLELLEQSPGTTFRLQLPPGQTAVALEPPQPTIPTSAPARQPAEGPRHSRPSVLVVEDNPEMRDLMERVLIERFDPVMVAGCDDAVAWLAGHSPRAILSDVLLGDRSGYDLLSTVRAQPRLRDTPVILVSALAEPEQRVKGLAAGADDYLGKPFSVEELKARLTNAIDRADARRAALRSQCDALLMELHDGVNAALTRATILLSAESVDGAPEKRVKDALEALTEAGDESRTMLSLLEAASEPWEAAVADVRNQLVRMCEKHGLEMEFSARGASEFVSPAITHALYRISKELLTNTIRHAGASRVACSIVLAGATLTLVIEDDGRGFDSESGCGRGLGIVKRRAARLGGRVQMGDRPEGGARIEVELPVAIKAATGAYG